MGGDSLPEAIERAEAVKENAAVPGSIRWIPPFLSLTSAISNSRKNQTLNTPAISTLVLMESQIRYLNDNGGLDWAVKRCERSADTVYS